MSGGPTAYVVEAFLPNGGTYMAYRIGRLLHRRFGFTPVALTRGTGPGHGRFEYDTPFELKPLGEAQRLVGPDDILVCNPSFSHLNLGLRLKGRKLMYVQGFTTFPLLDGFFDLYVSVSPFVRDFLRKVYGLDTEVVPPFLPGEPEEEGLPWAGRAPWSLALNLKGNPEGQQALLEALRGRLRAANPQVEAALPWEEALKAAAQPRSHQDMLRHLGRARYLLTLSTGEGFGLVPLEAMRMGACVLGLDGFGGRAYMDTRNGRFAPYPRLDLLARGMLEALGDDALAQRLALAGRETARAYTPERFEAAWTDILTRFVL